VCRRRIRLVGESGRVVATLSDDFHEMRCSIDHDGHRVTRIEGRTIRIPTSACPGAAAMLDELIGTATGRPSGAFYQQGRALRHCTHLYDLAVLAIRHAHRGAVTRLYEAMVPDELDDPIAIEILRDGMAVHRWHVRDGIIVAPAALNGRTLGKGFAHWAAAMWDEDQLEAATILARTWLIAIGRQYLIDSVAGQPILQNSEMVGRCFAYQADHAAGAIFQPGNVRDFTTGIFETEADDA